MSKMIYVRSPSNDIFFNLALERYLFKRFENETEKYFVLFLWQNDKCVVIGRNQNPYNQCNIEELRKNEVTLSRRETGGGAVFHDFGNLCFSFISPKSDYDIERNIRVIVDSLKSFNVFSEFSDRKDILVNGLKFSGNAFHSNQHYGLHHGTILLNTDLDMLDKILTVTQEKVEPKGIDSVRSRVVNLSNLNYEISTDALCNRIREQFICEYQCKDIIQYDENDIMEAAEDTIFKDLYTQYKSDSWIWE